MRRLKVLVVDDQRLRLDAIRVLLEREEDISVVPVSTREGRCRSSAKPGPTSGCSSMCGCPEMDGLNRLESLRERYPSIAVVMLSAIDDPCSFVLLSSAAPPCSCSSVSTCGILAAAVLPVNCSGSIFLSLDAAAANPAAALEEAGLSPRELSILEALQAGCFVIVKSPEGCSWPNRRGFPPDQHLPQARRVELYRGCPCPVISRSPAAALECRLATRPTGPQLQDVRCFLRRRARNKLQ